jgi:dTDP-glucose 4,6-dehydratase|tara:strand:+ start:691 stop:1653 length:963 start_codon:yes stop_codon:yes gene_type:complete
VRSLRSILLTGGAGFIGSTLARQLLARPDVEQLVVLDRLTYAGSRANLITLDQDDRFHFVEGDIRDLGLVTNLLEKHHCSGIMNLAAESSVDRSIKNHEDFITTNVSGTAGLLQAARTVDVSFLQCSTDEVYGSALFPNQLDESAKIRPSSPYSASKASADLMVQAAHTTYGQDVVIARCTNTYGPRQHLEKLIPTIIYHALRDLPVPIYGTGQQIRDWIHVDDCAKGLISVFEKGFSNRAYNLGAKCERTNLGIARVILKQLHKPESLIDHIQDRPGHDARYAINPRLALIELEWRARIPFRSGFEAVIRELSQSLRPS